MKTIPTILLMTTMFLLTQKTSLAQNSTKTSALKHVSETSEQADNLYGRKIQQQSLTKNSFENINTVATKKQASKKCAGHKRRHR